MGTFAELFKFKHAEVPQDKTEEFVKRIEKLFQAGGMMEVKGVQLYGKEVATIGKARMREGGMNFYYNYFEDDFWENAGFCKKDKEVWSGKIGWRQFHTVMVAAYTLEEIYTEGYTAVLVDGDMVTSWGYVGWINYLFHEEFHVKNFDPWKIFEEFHYLSERNETYMDWNYLSGKKYGLIGACEINAVMNGTEKALAKFGGGDVEEDIGNLSIKVMMKEKQFLQQYKAMSGASEKEQLSFLMKTLKVYYRENDKNMMEETEGQLKKFWECFQISDAPAFAVKVVSETYDKDFWELWGEIKDSVKRKNEKLYGNQGYYVAPVSTMQLLRQTADDMILYWKEDGDIEFSEELKLWFQMLRTQFDLFIEGEMQVEKPLKYILKLMEYADENYYRIYTITEFFEESMDNIHDKRYLVLWKLYENMLYDSELEEAGSVIFVPEGPEYEHVGLHYLGQEPKRRLLKNWDMMEMSKRNNKARVTLRRYMALVANKPLRKKVFGF